MESDSCVTVTHFINPHLFWYKAIEPPDGKLHVLTTLEECLLELYKNKPSCDNFLRPQVGDKVAVNFVAWNKFIRVEILQKAEFQKEHYVVWALDYGFPLLTKKEYLRNLPTKLQLDIGNVQIGGIVNIYPAEQEYDDMEGNLVMIRKDSWLQKACDMLEKLLSDANSVSFYKRYETENGHVWGDLIIVNHKGVEINARDYLLKTTNAVEEDKLTFKETCSKFKTIKIAKWLTNDGNSKMKINNIKHNYIEHTKQMNATLVDENAKRKVEDWQQRNERKKIEGAIDIFETSFDMCEDNIDDVSFDDSVSVTHSQQVNYIGKAGILTRIKQQKYSSEKNLPPSALSKYFDIDDVLIDLNFPAEPPQPYSSCSGPTFSGVEKHSQLHIKQESANGLEEEMTNSDLLNIHHQTSPLLDLESAATSKISSVKRQEQLLEFRKKLGRAEREKKINESAALKPMYDQNETNNSTISRSKKSDSYSYKLLEQSLTLSSLNNTSTDKAQDNKSELSVNNVRVKQLIAMRKKYASSSLPSNDSSMINATTESQFSRTEHSDEDKNDIHSLNTLNFQLKLKTSSKPEGKIGNLHQISSASSSSKNTVKENLKYDQNETTNSTINQTPKSDSYSYQLLEQSLGLSTLNNTQDNKSELSVNNVRVKQLIAMRKKYASSSLPSNDSSLLNATMESQFSTTDHPDAKDKNFIHSLNTLNFQLKPKTFSKPEDKIENLHQISSSSPSSKNTVKENLKISQSFDSFTMVPAGFDITRLSTYKDEKNHWHRKKSTRYDYIPHEPTSSADEVLFNNTNDTSFSSSNFSQLKSFNVSQSSKDQFNRITSAVNKTPNNANIEQYSKFEICSQQEESTKDFEVKNVGGNNLSSELSTSSNSPVLCQKLRKRRQLKSPTSQLLKIDKILKEHSIEKEFGNTNIMDLKLLNTSSSSQKSLLASTSSNISCNNRNVPIIDKNININNSCSHSSSSDNTRNEKVHKDTLMNVKHTEYLPIVKGERKIQTKFIDHLVLAHSSIQLTPIENISDAPFLPEIHEEMRQMRVNKVYRIQVYSWSHVLRNNSLFVVNPSRSGKTWSYLPPLCSLLCCRKDAFKPSYGPVAIILVASLKHVELINNYCRRLMNGLKAEAPTCIPSYGMRNLIETKVHLLNGCGILIATPANVLRLLNENKNEPLFDGERLQHIVIDDMDIMMSRSQQDFENACSILFKMGKNSNLKKLSPQLIVTSRDWDGLMVKFIRKSNQPLLLIGDFLEAAVYGHATLSVKFKSNTEKNGTILKFIKEMSGSAECWDNRTLILCNEDEDVHNVCKFLQDCGYPCLAYYSRSTENERVTINEWKNKVSSQILVCTDVCFCELKIQNVNNLIHYSMPTSWTQFTLRFSAFARTYNNYVCSFEHNILSTTNASKKNYSHSLILLDENNNLQLPRVVDFMRKHNQVVLDEIQAVSRRVLIMREEQRILNASLLCPQLLEFGECDEARCDNRHELTRFDVIKKSDGIPSSGEIRIHVLKVFSPTYYTVRLLHHKLPNAKKWVETRRSSEALTFSIQLNMHYQNDKNLFLHWPPYINDVCIYQYVGNFRRARILEAPIFQKNMTNVVQSDLKVILRLIDDGIVITSVKCSEIFVCDKKFKEFPPQAVDVRLMKVVPFDNERSWDSKTTKQVHKWIIEEIKSNYVVQASIDFSLTNTIWVNNLVVLEKLTGIDAYCPVVDLKKSLVVNNFGVLYDGDRKHVRDLANEYGLLNCNEFDIDNTDSDIDFQSCNNESINLIRFSSSNDETINSSMESAETSLDQLKKIVDKTIDVEAAKKETKSAVVAIETLPHDEEDWDDNLVTGHQLDEVYVPIEVANVDKDENNLKDKFSKEESWSKLPLNELVKVEIGDEGENGNWESIFLQVIDKKSMLLFEDLNRLIIKHVEKVKSNKERQNKIYDFEPLHNCVVRYNNLYLRAKVYGVYGENINQRLYRFFLCDYACFTNAKTEELYNDFLYDTTEEIVNFTPYQAIHCTLAGIKWNRFTKRYQVTKDYLYACAVLKSDSKENYATNLHNLPIRSYKILLYECENENEFSSALLFNKSLVDNGITVYDEETKNFLEYEIGIQDNEEHKLSNTTNDNIEETYDVPKTNNKDEVLTYQQLMNFIKSDVFDIELDNIFTDGKKLEMKSLQNNAHEIASQETISKSEKTVMITDSGKKEIHKVLKEKSKIPTSDSEIDEQGHCTSYSNSSIKSSISLISTDISNGSELEAPLPPPPSLKALYRRPLTTWYQNDCMIFISIHAPDVKDYSLEVTSKTILFAAEIQSEKSVLILNLLGSIDSKKVSHEIKGLNAVIRLKKNVFIKWPRLLQESRKYFWLKYNFNAFDSMEMEYIMPQQLFHTILDNELNFEGQQIDKYNSDEDNERELYQTYNPIQDNDEDYDPFSAY